MYLHNAVTDIILNRSPSGGRPTSEGDISNQQEATELRDNAKQEFISEFIAEHRNDIISNLDRIAELAKDAEDDKYERLFDAMAELAYSGSSKQLQAVIDEIIDDYLEEQAEKEWEAER